MPQRNGRPLSGSEPPNGILWKRLKPIRKRTGNGIGSLRSSRPRNLNRKPKRHRLFLWSQLLPEEVSGVTVYFLNQGGKAGTGNAEWQTIIAEQEDRSILLPDGSSVYLRENSELSYPEVFASSVREVKIRGEAFFEVTPNSEQPFIVDASGLSVKVLGTSFSVQTSDQGNEISVILVEGKVSLNNAHEKELVQLHPNQKADYFVNDEHYTVTEVDSERLTSWRKGIIFYDNASLDEIVRLIEQTYKVSLMYTRPENDDQRFSGAFLKTQKLETVLQQTNKLTGTNLILIQ